MESTIHNPTAYFESLFSSNELQRMIDNYLDEIVEHSGLKIERIDKKRGIIRYLEYDLDGNNVIEMEDKFETKLNNILFSQFTISKSLIDSAVTQRAVSSDDYISFLLFQEKHLQYIINIGKDKIELFPILIKPITGIQRYINTKYLSDNVKKIFLNTSSLNFNQSTPQILNDSQIIFSVLGYLKHENDKRQKIMSDEQFDLMIGYFQFYIENNTLPPTITKVDPLKISKSLLRFTFWVLHKKLYTTSSIREDFVRLIKEVFSDFDDWDFATLKTKFGNKDKVTHNAVRFIPEIIKSELREFN